MKEVRPLRAYAEVALGRQRSPQHVSGAYMVPYLRAANVKDGILDLSDIKSMNFNPKEQRQFALLHGDVLVSEGSGSLAAVGATAVWRGDIHGVICFQNTLLRLRPRPSTDSRFLGWWCRHAFADGLFAGIATGANIFHISAERVRALPMTYLKLAEQRAIADFLDTETARIDALVTKKRRMIELLRLRLAEAGRLVTRSSLDPSSSEGIQLRRIATLQAGAAFPHERQGDSTGTIPYVKVGDLSNVDDLGYLQGAANRVSTEVASDLRSPVLPIGTIVLPKIGAALLTNKRAILSEPSCLDQNVMGVTVRVGNSRFVFHCLSKVDLGVLSTPGPVPLLNEEAALSVRIPWPPEAEQDRATRQLDGLRARHAALSEVVNRQIDLLTEHRQALITAAVTGELELPKAA